MALEIPAIHNRIADAFYPHVDAAADHATLTSGRRVEAGSVNAVRDPVVFKRKIIQSFRHRTSENLRWKRWHRCFGEFDNEAGFLFSNGKIMLKKQFIVEREAVVGIEIGDLRWDDLAGICPANLDMIELHIGQVAAHFGKRQHDHLGGASGIEIVRDHDLKLLRRCGNQRRNSAESRNEQKNYGGKRTQDNTVISKKSLPSIR